MTYFLATFTISWGGAFLVAAPHLLAHHGITQSDAFAPVMLLGPSLSGIGMVGIAGGRAGLRGLLARMARWRVGARWYAVALILLVLILLVLLSMRALVSAAFAPNLFAIGIVFGLVPAFLEEIGCTGFAFPALSTGRGALSAGLLLGVLWGLWHLPVVDHLGAAGPHGAYAVPFAVAFVSAMTALRALISWLYIRTESVLLAQLMHLSSTGSLVVLGPAHVSPAQEALWYGVYAGALWFVVVLIATQSRLR